MFCDTNEIETFKQKVTNASINNAKIGDPIMEIRGWFITFFFPTVAALLGTIFLEDFKNLLLSSSNSISFYLVIFVFVNLVSLYSLHSELKEKNWTPEKTWFSKKILINYIVFLTLLFLIEFKYFTNENIISLMIAIYVFFNMVFAATILLIKNDVKNIDFIYFMLYFVSSLLLGNIVFLLETVNLYYSKIYFLLIFTMMFYVGALYCMHFSICEIKGIYKSTKQDFGYLNEKIGNETSDRK